MTKRSSLMSKVIVFMLAFAVIFTYSVMPMNQAYAASKKPAQVKSLKAKAVSSSSITLTWKKTKNAKKYQVYMSTAKKGKYKKVATLKKSKKTYTVSGLKASTRYYFKVRALNGKKKGKYSKVRNAVTLAAPAPTPAPEPVDTPATIGDAKTVTHTVSVDMSKYEVQEGKSVKVWIPVPQTDEINGYQVVSEPTFTAENATDARITTDKQYGNKMFYVEWNDKVAPGDRKATVTYTATRFDVKRTDLKDDPKAPLSSEAKAYVNKESTYVNISDPIVKKYAAEAVSKVSNKNSTLEKTRAIYEWVIANLARLDNGEWVPDDSDPTGKHTYGVEGCGYGDTKKILSEFDKYGIAGGHCTDLNSTFVALCRANGIAAREMFGIRLGNEGEDITGYQHCWAEFYLPGTGWVFADPADVLKAIKPAKAEDNQIDINAWKEAKASEKCAERTEFFWGHVDNNRVVLSRGRDVTFEPAQAWGPCNTFGYPAAEVNGERMPADFTDGKNFHYEIAHSILKPSMMTADELYEGLGTGEYKILDTRANADYKVGHIPGAVSADVSAAASGKDYASAEKNVLNAIKGDAEDTKYAIICYSGNKYANITAGILLTYGVKPENALILAQDDKTQGANGGMKAWQKYADKGFIVSEVTSNAGVINNGITADDLEKALSNEPSKFAVMDVRAKADYDKGHIDGAYLATCPGSGATDAARTAVKKVVDEYGKDALYVNCCYTGQKCADTADSILKELGVPESNIIRLIGGMNNGWKDKPMVDSIPAVSENTVYVTPEWVNSAIHGRQAGYENVVVCEVNYDTKGNTTYAQGHIPGAIKAGVVEVEDATGDAKGAYNLLAAETVKENLLKNGITSDTKVILYDAGGDPCEVGRQAYGYLWCGVKDVKILNGHLKAWEDAGFPLETKENAPVAASDFGVSVPAHPEYWTSITDARAKMDKENEAYDPNFKLVSIRSEGEWLGTTSGYGYIHKAGEPDGAVWGKGAKTAFDVADFVNEDETVKDLDGFKEVWKDCNFKVDDSEHLSFYCGTGWRATVPFLVLYENGYKNISVYDGGWYEWIMHEDYPVQLGDPASGNCQHVFVKDLPEKDY